MMPNLERDPSGETWLIQTSLQAAGFDIEADNWKGPKTVLALRSLRRRWKDRWRVKQWVLANPGRSREIKKQYKIRNREKVLEQERERMRRKREGYTEEEKASRLAYDKVRHHKNYCFNINYRMRISLRTRLYKALKGIAKCKRTEKLLGCSIDSFKIYIESKFTNGMTWENYGKWHIDHILPCAAFDLSKPDHQERCFHFSNMQPLWAIDNLKKGDSVP